MNPHPKSISRIMATARAPPPCRSFVGSFQASEKTPNFTALSNWLPHPAQPPFTLDRFLNPPCSGQVVQYWDLDFLAMLAKHHPNGRTGKEQLCIE